MFNRHKIIAMTKMAIYDKNEGDADRLANQFFRHDYIYRKNLWTRLCAGGGALVLVAFYWLRVFFVDGVDLLEADLAQMGWDSLMFLLAVLALYSVIGTVQATRQYYLVQKRLEQYQALAHQLERINERAKRQAETE